MNQITVEVFYQEAKERLRLSLVSGEKAMSKRNIVGVDINRMGMALTGYLKWFPSDRVQLIGKTEYGREIFGLPANPPHAKDGEPGHNHQYWGRVNIIFVLEIRRLTVRIVPGEVRIGKVVLSNHLMLAAGILGTTGSSLARILDCGAGGVVTPVRALLRLMGGSSIPWASPTHHANLHWR